MQENKDVREFVDRCLKWLDVSPEMRSIKPKMFAFVLGALHPTQVEHGADIRANCESFFGVTLTPAQKDHHNDWEVLGEAVCASLGDGTDEAAQWVKAILRFHPPHHAHGRTMLGGIDEELGRFGANYAGVVKLLREQSMEEEQERQEAVKPVKVETKLVTVPNEILQPKEEPTDAKAEAGTVERQPEPKPQPKPYQRPQGRR